MVVRWRLYQPIFVLAEPAAIKAARLAAAVTIRTKRALIVMHVHLMSYLQPT